MTNDKATKIDYDKEHKALWTKRVRFNSGYHDGTLAEEQNWKNKLSHFDMVYFEGYKLGRRDRFELGFRPETSDKAWKEHQDNLMGKLMIDAIVAQATK